MGATQAIGMAQAAANGDISLRQALHYHLTINHFPPVPSDMIEPCLRAIDAVNDGRDDKLVFLPDGITYRGRGAAPAWAIVEQHHLGAFLNGSEDLLDDDEDGVE